MVHKVKSDKGVGRLRRRLKFDAVTVTKLQCRNTTQHPNSCTPLSVTRHTPINMTYQWTTSKTAGLVMGILFLTALLTAAVLIYRYRVRTTSTKRDPESAATSPEPEAEPEHTYALPGPIHEPGTIRRATGQPQTFYDWVRSSNAQAELERLPSLKNGPGYGAVSSTYSQHTSSRANTMVRPTTRDSVGASSLRKAVLGAGETRGVKSMEAEKKEAMLKKEEIKDAEQKAKTEVKTTAKTRGYSGAWP
ncbi:hypothetical protein HBI46_108930 [Parastagonospora nodorum]|nr:hypothetical protein HBI62_146910 [Parastagonospora nodorum]KAH5419014.1 hypothetical protein HBI46_108930 [Parastagonospora nodorum]KAH6139375.1 hypothetical protein HBI63_213770 [Parastagonospora nodorum]KAH6164877.1 hypothetical protein HBI61_212610 [Parastagonospora nodorum]KAH6454014.1 hypothetical protein HBI57_144810 [Parastagonospora nodorum]